MIPVTDLQAGERVMVRSNHHALPLLMLFEGIFASEDEAVTRPGLVLSHGELPGRGAVAKFFIPPMHGLFRVMADGTMRDDVGGEIEIARVKWVPQG